MSKTLEEALKKPLKKTEEALASEEVALSVRALCSKILSVRYEVKNLPTLISEALSLALVDYVKHKNTNSFKVILTLKQDKKSVYNLPYVKDFLTYLGLAFTYNAKEEALTIDEFKRFNSEEALKVSFKDFREAKIKEAREANKALALEAHKAKEEALKKLLEDNGVKSSLAYEEALKLLNA